MSKQSETVRLLLADRKGLLAMDESNATCDRRFATQHIAQDEEARRAYRELIVTTPGLSEYVSGAILYDETISGGQIGPLASARPNAMNLPRASQASRWTLTFLFARARCSTQRCKYGRARRPIVRPPNAR
jgi:fructose-bisphosphate aldolase class 1